MKYKPSYWQRRQLWDYETRETTAVNAATSATPAGLRDHIAPIYNETLAATGSVIEASRAVLDRLPGQYLALSDEAICDLAEKIANHCLSEYAAGYAQTPDELVDAARHFAPQILRAEYIGFPTYATETGKRDRCFDHLFWRRKLRTIIRQARECVHLDLSAIGPGRQTYCSDDAVTERADQIARLNFFLDSHEIVDRQTGEIFSLGSVANTYEKTEARMLNRINGLEQYAKGHGMTAIFVTLTLSEFYHPAPTTKSSWAGYTPKDGQVELAGRWARTQNRLNKSGIPYGFFRVVEPHKDGCPHWHMCIWSNPAHHWQIMDEIYREFLDARQQDRNGQVDYWQVKVSTEDETKGNSAAYMRKYLTKNTSSKLDAGKNDPLEWSQRRVDAWRACWKINAFRFGGSIIPTGAIGHFDELFRLERKPDGLPQGIWDAVEERDFCGFLVELRESKRMKYANEPKENQYGEPTKKKRGIELDELCSILCREPGRFEMVEKDARIKNLQESKGREIPEPRQGHFGVVAPQIPIGHPLEDWLTDLY